jgi:hypothetical protein
MLLFLFFSDLICRCCYCVYFILFFYLVPFKRMEYLCCDRIPFIIIHKGAPGIKIGHVVSAVWYTFSPKGSLVAFARDNFPTLTITPSFCDNQNFRSIIWSYHRSQQNTPNSTNYVGRIKCTIRSNVCLLYWELSLHAAVLDDNEFVRKCRWWPVVRPNYSL